MRYVGQGRTRVHILPCHIKLQGLLYTEIGIIQTLIHSAGVIKGLGLLLQDIARKTEPLRKVFVHGLRPFFCFRKFILQTQCQDSPMQTHDVHQLCPMEFSEWIRVGSSSQSPNKGSTPSLYNSLAIFFRSAADKSLYTAS